MIAKGQLSLLNASATGRWFIPGHLQLYASNAYRRLYNDTAWKPYKSRLAYLPKPQCMLTLAFWIFPSQQRRTAPRSSGSPSSQLYDLLSVCKCFSRLQTGLVCRPSPLLARFQSCTPSFGLSLSAEHRSMDRRFETWKRSSPRVERESLASPNSSLCVKAGGEKKKDVTTNSRFRGTGHYNVIRAVLFSSNVLGWVKIGNGGKSSTSRLDREKSRGGKNCFLHLRKLLIKGMMERIKVLTFPCVTNVSCLQNSRSSAQECVE